MAGRCGRVGFRPIENFYQVDWLKYSYRKGRAWVSSRNSGTVLKSSKGEGPRSLVLVVRKTSLVVVDDAYSAQLILQRLVQRNFVEVRR